MIPIISFRSFTTDQYIIDKVFYENCYKLRAFKENGPTVIDIGSHIGIFSFASNALGASKIYAFEPDLANFSLLLKNTKLMSNVSCFPVGIYNITKDIYFNSNRKAINKSYIDFSQAEIASVPSEGFYPVKCYNIDKLIDEYINKTIDILKINIGYSELNILDSENLSKVNSICGETELKDEDILKVQARFIDKGFKDSKFLKSPDENKKLFWFARNKLEDFYHFPQNT